MRRKNIGVGMRNLFRLSALAGLPKAAVDHPERLRRETIARNAWLLLAAAAIGVVPAVLDATHGASLTMVLVLIGAFAGMAAAMLCRDGQFDRAVAIEVAAFLACGLALTLSNTAMVDFGLAVALLAPVLASLLGQPRLAKAAWVAVVGVVTVSAVASVTGQAWTQQGMDIPLRGAISFALLAGIVAFSASRLNSAFGVYERAQMNVYRHLVEHVQDAVLRFAEDGSVAFASQSSETLLGCRRFELTGGGLLERVHIHDRPAYLSALAAANRDGVARTVDLRIRRDDPAGDVRGTTYRWIEAALSPVHEGQGRDNRFEIVALLRDITARKDIETEMAAARKVAEDASEAKSRFLAMVGHELRTPLNAIVGFSEMMTTGVGGDLSATHREYAELIHRSGNHLLDVVRALLDMSRLEAGRFELQAEPFDAAALLAPCIEMVEASAKARGIAIRTELGRESGSGRCRRTRLPADPDQPALERHQVQS